MRTIIIRRENVKLNNPILLEGLPGLALVGKITVEYLIRELRASLLAEIYSHHFPHYVLVEKGIPRLLSCRIYYWKNTNSNNDLLLLSGDAQAQTIVGQYEIADAILRFVKEQNGSCIITIGGYCSPVSSKERKVYASATNPSLLNKLRDSGCEISPAGSPIVGTAGLLVGLAKFQNIDAICLLGETLGHMPDFEASKSVLSVLAKFLKIKIDLTKLDEKLREIDTFLKKLEKIGEKMEDYERFFREVEKYRTTYIA